MDGGMGMADDTIRVRLVCGCLLTLGSVAEQAPMCEQHGERRVRAVQAPSPRFTAVNCDPSKMGPLVKGVQ